MKTWAIWGGLAVMAFFTYIVWFPPQPTAKDRDRDAISFCWKEYERKSLDPGTKRSIALTCEGMEAKFKTTYGVNP